MGRIDLRETLAHTDPLKVRVRLKTFEQIFDNVSTDQLQVIETLAELYSSLDYELAPEDVDIIEAKLTQLDVNPLAVDSILEWVSL